MHQTPAVLRIFRETAGILYYIKLKNSLSRAVRKTALRAYHSSLHCFAHKRALKVAKNGRKKSVKCKIRS